MRGKAKQAKKKRGTTGKARAGIQRRHRGRDPIQGGFDARPERGAATADKSPLARGLFVGAGQLFPCEPPARCSAHNVEETAAVAVFILPSIEAVCLLVEVAVKVERRAVNVCALDRAFQQAPKVFKAVRVNTVFHI